MSAPTGSKYPDTIAIVFDESRSKVSCVYNDHSLYIWDLRDIRRVGKSHSFLYHSACIWGVETVPSNFLRNGSAQSNLPSDCFITCSSDDTIRFWGLDNCETNEVFRKNVYSKDLLKLLYIDSELNFIKDTDNPTSSNEKSSSYDGRNGVRCIKISAENDQLATGDRSGNIRIYDLKTMKQIQAIEAHDSEVLCLEYTNDKIEKRLLASASRDRLIHVFDVENKYNILQTLDDHSSSITSVKFIGSGLTFQMISCGADKSIIFRNYQNNQFTRGNNCSGKNTLYDMEVDSTAKHILTACQDRNIRVYGTQNAKHTKTFKGSHSDEGTLIKLSLDLSGIYIATSCTDKTLSVYDYYSNECMAKMYGHSELVTGLKFTNDCKHLISASGDGCIFVWQVPHDMIVTMQARLSQQAMRSGHAPTIQRQLTNPFSDSLHTEQSFGSPPGWNDDVPTTPSYKLSEVGQLPMWAKKKPDDPSSSPVMGSSPNQNQVRIYLWLANSKDFNFFLFRSNWIIRSHVGNGLNVVSSTLSHLTYEASSTRLIHQRKLATTSWSATTLQHPVTTAAARRMFTAIISAKTVRSTAAWKIDAIIRSVHRRLWWTTAKCTVWILNQTQSMMAMLRTFLMVKERAQIMGWFTIPEPMHRHQRKKFLSSFFLFPLFCFNFFNNFPEHFQRVQS